ncbi:MAG: GNAT family N-acetyltransferase [Ancrocorticia sp.]
MSITIKPCTEADLDDLRKASIETFVETFGDQNTDEDINEYVRNSLSRAELRRQMREQESAFFFAVIDDDVAGYLKLNVGAAQTEQVGEDALEVERIYALRRFKRQGLGTLMMERAMNEAANRGLNTVWLGVWEHNVAAQRFYERLGFSVFGSHVFTLGDDEQTDLLMKRAV